MVTKAKKEKLPGFSIGVRDNAAVRMVKLARPICPNSKLKMVKDENGKWVRSEEQLANCQLAGGKWWIDCEARGHEPYFSTQTWYEAQDVMEEVEEGVFEVKGTRRIRHRTKRPNVAQVAVSVRVNSGRGARFKIERHGFARLATIGFDEVCQYRNCQKPISDAGKGGSRYGDYCSAEHLALIAADAEGILLHYPNSNLNGEEFQKVERLRAKELREASAIARG